ncbi:hypothetical protein [Flavobacterium silvaticum]|uniref:Uncharacterized protein n=1 Tax=Flavobacterium silvaticum TaxID=1852020 RepID=A0A972JGY9_9FLAO|nr:hypothetical protein [Flavobacterium silvaticum]NMH28691.1 hypothetical protein [Flavobacterium silvaticum]
MPANPKYLTTSTLQRFLKISAAIVGGYLVSASFHLMLTAYFDKGIVLITSAYTGFIVWAALMIVAFLFKSGWKAWTTYAGLSIAFLLLTYFGLMLDN